MECQCMHIRIPPHLPAYLVLWENIILDMKVDGVGTAIVVTFSLTTISSCCSFFILSWDETHFLPSWWTLTLPLLVTADQTVFKTFWSLNRKKHKGIRSCNNICWRFKGIDMKYLYLPSIQMNFAPTTQKSYAAYEFMCQCDSGYVGHTTQSLGGGEG